jgi:uncharacterized protein (DUF1330 family)
VSAYLIALNKIVDREALARYREVVSPIFPAYVVRHFASVPGTVECITGEWSGDHIGVLEFESMQRLREFLATPEWKLGMEIAGAAVERSVVAFDAVQP